MASIKVGDVFTNNQGCRAIVLAYNNKNDVLIEFLDHYIYRRSVFACALQNGGFKNLLYPSVVGVGCIGVGEYAAKINGVVTRAYHAWGNMLTRCYDERLRSRFPTYADCTVCESWLNYQNFAKWFNENNYNIDDYEVDKDLIKNGNKVYCPQFCALVPRDLNILLSKPKITSKKLPVGVSRNGKSFRSRYSGLDNITIFIGNFKTAQEAHQEYVIAKEAYVKEVANKWRGRIDERVYNSLMNWTVN